MIDAGLIDRIARKTETPNAYGCMIWHGTYGGGNRAKGMGGRPQIRWRGRMVYVARVVLSYRLGRLLRPHKVAAHSCDNPCCVNPDHLEEESYSNNVRAHWCRQRSQCRPKTFVNPPKGKDARRTRRRRTRMR